jgi:L-arabinokinase
MCWDATLGSPTSGVQQVYEELGLSPEQHLVVFIYGGQPPGDWQLREQCLPEGWVCVVCAAGSPGSAALPGNFRLAPADAYTPDLVRTPDISSPWEVIVSLPHAGLS